MKNSYDWLTGRFETAKERKCELKDRLTEIFPTKMQRCFSKTD